MNFNKCERCGCFFITGEAVCPVCTQKDNNEISKLHNYFSENEMPANINELSNATGISIKNLSRYANKKDFKKQILL